MKMRDLEVWLLVGSLLVLIALLSASVIMAMGEAGGQEGRPGHGDWRCRCK